MSTAPVSSEGAQEQAPSPEPEIEILLVPWYRRMTAGDPNVHLVGSDGERFWQAALCQTRSKAWTEAQRGAALCADCIVGAQTRIAENPALVKRPPETGRRRDDGFEPDTSATCPGCGCKSPEMKATGMCPICGSRKRVTAAGR